MREAYNDSRQPYLSMIQPMKGGVSAPPRPPPARGRLLAKARSLTFIQEAMVRLKFGQAAASPAPIMKRTKIREYIAGIIFGGRMLVAQAVSAVKADHQMMAAVRILRGP